MTNSPIEEIKARLGLVELIQSYLRLEKAGVNFRACCPFHSEKTPSFFVSPSRQIWHCFGCGEGGDHFKFVMKIEGLEFPEALKLLAGKSGVELKREDPRIISERNRLYDLVEESAKIFETSLLRTPAVLSYLRKRGVTDTTIKEFRLGFAPQSWDFLLHSLANCGFKKEEIEKSGLAIRSEDGTSWYDRFRGRIMFPIADGHGRVVGFGGRIFEAKRSEGPAADLQPEASGVSYAAKEPIAKYINTPNTLIYDKSRALYAFDKAKDEIRRTQCAVIVEGYMDAIMSHQAGVKNTVAVSGTALTLPQLKILRRLSNMLISSFDSDSAGETATKKSLDLASSLDFSRKVAIIPSGKDPADAVAESPEKWREAVKNAKDIVDFFRERALNKFDQRSVEGKKAIASYVLPEIARLENQIEKAHWMAALARDLGVGEDLLWAELKKTNIGTASFPESEGGTDMRFRNRRELLEERMLALMSLVDDSRSLPDGFREDYYAVFSSAENENFFRSMVGLDDSTKNNFSKEYIDLLHLKGEVTCATIPEPEAELTKVMQEFERECARERLNQLSQEIARAEQNRDLAMRDKLLREFNAFSAKAV